ncbi:TetR/AcrR family transcriptional regulator [Burkholderia sp. Cy-637]|uniref:TetR/AcrR family transcriptional regulator n=1 Tax=Burkholderia sp. Cy-637 TaxID=2608327 RepID=UPI00141F8719|nr:TetR/AcrR family transcriptional regulator [Burkholderia sp. Cy-637]NIF90553.1 TetR/AcrR family transcriptional regulator [Burkholderia sp. Cy-637]
MARPREFDEQAVLDAAIAQFWSHGYASTSVRDLATTMGMTGASVYNAFGDKRALYARSFERYVEAGFRDRVRRFEHRLAPREAIVAFFDEIIRLTVQDAQRKGCMIVNTALELAPHDADFQQLLERILEDIEAFFLRCVEAGQAEGTIPPELAAVDTARMLFAVLLGLRVLARVRPRRELLEGAVRPALAMIGASLPAAKRRGPAQET